MIFLNLFFQVVIVALIMSMFRPSLYEPENIGDPYATVHMNETLKVRDTFSEANTSRVKVIYSFLSYKLYTCIF